MNSINKLTFLSILWVAIFNTSCNGQVKKDLPKDKESEPKIISVGQPKRVAANRVVLMRKQKMCQFEASSQQGCDLFKLTHFQYVQM